MYYRLNFQLKTFGTNHSVTTQVIANDEKELELFLKGYKEVTQDCQVYKIEIEIEGKRTIKTTTRIK